MTAKMYNWTIGDKLVIAFKAFLFGPIIYFIESYVFNDWNFLITVVLLLFLDALVLSIMALLIRDYKIEEAFRSFLLKSLAISLTIIVISIIDLSFIRGEKPLAIQWVNMGFYAVLLTFIGISILKNIYRIYPWDAIKYLLDKLDKFKEPPKQL